MIGSIGFRIILSKQLRQPTDRHSNAPRLFLPQIEVPLGLIIEIGDRDNEAVGGAHDVAALAFLGGLGRKHAAGFFSHAP